MTPEQCRALRLVRVLFVLTMLALAAEGVRMAVVP
jgi:hypothetical protein